MNTLDFIVILIFVFSILGGYRRGFILQAMEIIAFFVGILIFKSMYPYVLEFLTTNDVSQNVVNSILSGINIDSMIRGGQISIVEYINDLEIPNIMKNYMISIADNEVYVTNIGDQIRAFFSTIILNIITTILVLITTIIITRVLISIARKLTKISAIEFSNKSLGLLLGGVFGFIRVSLFAGVISILAIFPDFDALREQINGIIISPIIENNASILVKIVIDMIN